MADIIDFQKKKDEKSKKEEYKDKKEEARITGKILKRIEHLLPKDKKDENPEPPEAS